MNIAYGLYVSTYGRFHKSEFMPYQTLRTVYTRNSWDETARVRECGNEVEQTKPPPARRLAPPRRSGHGDPPRGPRVVLGEARCAGAALTSPREPRSPHARSGNVNCNERCVTWAAWSGAGIRAQLKDCLNALLHALPEEPTPFIIDVRPAAAPPSLSQQPSRTRVGGCWPAGRGLPWGSSRREQRRTRVAEQRGLRR